MSYYREQLEDWLKTVDVKADKVLDAGGGANPVKGRTKSWEVKEYKILDNRLEKMRQEPDYVYDLNNPDCGREITGQWDVVFCLEVTEYLYNPLVAMRNLWGFLKKGGILYISFPFIYPHHEPAPYDYLRYTKWGIEKLMKESGFQIVEMIPRLEKSNVRRAGGIKIRLDGPNLIDWFRKEGMHPSKNFNEHNVIGYIVKAIKR